MKKLYKYHFDKNDKLTLRFHHTTVSDVRRLTVMFAFEIADSKNLLQFICNNNVAF